MKVRDFKLTRELNWSQRAQSLECPVTHREAKSGGRTWALVTQKPPMAITEHEFILPGQGKEVDVVDVTNWVHNEITRKIHLSDWIHSEWIPLEWNACHLYAQTHTQGYTDGGTVTVNPQVVPLHLTFRNKSFWSSEKSKETEDK
jgi:hypothetical protein